MIALYGIDAVLHGALVSLAVCLPAIWWSWRRAAPFADGHRALRPFVACCATFLAILAAGAIFALGFERKGYAGNVMVGALVGGAALLLPAFLILLLLPRKS